MPDTATFSLDELDKEIFGLAKNFIVPIGKEYRGKRMDDVAKTDEGLRWLLYVHTHGEIAREPFKTHLHNYINDKAIQREIELLGLSVRSSEE